MNENELKSIERYFNKFNEDAASFNEFEANDLIKLLKNNGRNDDAIEVGNTFKLGTKYAKALGLEYQDINNKLHPVEMGCYGFGLGRAMAAVVEQHNDEAGIIWPASIAPFEVAVVVVNSKDEEQMKVANALYEEMKKAGIDVVLDDRKERVGVKFKDMELIGIPYRITVGRGISEGNVEFRARTASENENVKLDEVVTKLQTILQK